MAIISQKESLEKEWEGERDTHVGRDEREGEGVFLFYTFKIWRNTHVCWRWSSPLPRRGPSAKIEFCDFRLRSFPFWRDGPPIIVVFVRPL